MIISYFKFKLSEDSQVSDSNKQRYNMIEFATIKNGLLPFKSKHGQIYFDMHDCNNDYNISFDSPAYIFYTANGLRLTAIYLEDDDNSEVCYAYDDLAVQLNDNSLISFTNDGYLLIINHKRTQIEVIGFEDCKGLMTTIYPLYTYGNYDFDIYQLVQVAQMQNEIEYNKSEELMPFCNSK